MTQPTARDSIRVPIGLAFAMANRPMSEVDELLDAYEAAHRNEVLTEAAELIAAASLARLDEIDEDDLKPSDMERHQEWCGAANVLFAARSTTAQES